MEQGRKFFSCFLAVSSVTSSLLLKNNKVFIGLENGKWLILSLTNYET